MERVVVGWRTGRSDGNVERFKRVKSRSVRSEYEDFAVVDHLFCGTVAGGR